TTLGCARQVSDEPPQQQARRRDLNERLARLHTALVVLGHPPIAGQPSETPFNDPAARLDAEAVRARLPCHDLEIPALALLLAPLRQFLAAIGGICPDLREAWDEEREPAQELARADRVMDIGRGDIAGNGQAQGIDQQMPFPALHALVRVVAADA